jgi:hypothetical protein
MNPLEREFHRSSTISIEEPERLLGTFLGRANYCHGNQNGAKPWVSEKVHCCGYWVYRSQSLSCLLFLCITDYCPAEGLRG